MVRSAGAAAPRAWPVQRSRVHKRRLIVEALEDRRLLSIWSSVAPMNTARTGDFAVLLPSGSVLVGGGASAASGGTTLASCELYNPTNNTWSSTGSLNTARTGATAALLTAGPNAGDVLVAGGENSASQDELSSVELYNPSTGQWTITAPPPLNPARFGTLTTTVLPSGPYAGDVLIAGGYSGASGGVLRTAELYSASTGTWTSTANTMDWPRIAATAIFLTKGGYAGDVLVAGGNVDGIVGDDTSDADLYNPATNTWTYGFTMNAAMHSLKSTLLSNGDALVNGLEGSSNMPPELFDPTSGVWTNTANPLNNNNDNLVTLGSGPYADQAMLVEGIVLGTTVALYNPAGNAWQYISIPSLPANGWSETVLGNGNVLLAGGTSGSAAVASAEIFAIGGPTPTTTTLQASPATVTAGQAVTFTATVTPTSGPFDNGGTVQFLVDGTAFGSPQNVNGSGAAAIQDSGLSAGRHVVTAAYSGETNFAASSTVLGSNSIVSSAAGNGNPSYNGDGIAGTAGQLSWPANIAADAAGDVFIADAGNNRVREVNHASGLITTVAGNGTWGHYGDNGSATLAELAVPEGVAVDSAGDLFIADSGNNCVREVSTSGLITTVAGNTTLGFSGDNNPATAAELDNPVAVAVDSAGDLFIADDGNNRIREVNHANHVITTVAGNGTAGPSGDNGFATAAELNGPCSLATDAAGDIFIADRGNNRVRMVNQASHLISTVAGNGTAGYNGDNIQATAAELNFPLGVAADAAGDVFIADDYNCFVREVNHSTGLISDVAGNGGIYYNGDGGPATDAAVLDPFGVAVDAAGDIFIGDQFNNRVREVDHTNSVITTIAGGGNPGDGGQATAADLNNPTAVAADSAGDLFIADQPNYRIREVNRANGAISTVAGNGTWGYTGDNGPATAAQLSYATGIAIDTAGDIFIADSSNARIREVNHATGLITTVVGNGTAGWSGDNGFATAAELNVPTGVTLDSAGDLFIVDAGNGRIREVSASGIITTVAGGGSAGLGDNGAATAAELSLPTNGPTGLAVDSAGDIFIADAGNNRVREVNHANHIITTVAGNGSVGSSGDGGFATAAEFDNPSGVAIDSAGDLFIDDTYNNRIREVNLSTGVIVTFAGTGSADSQFGGDGGPAAAADFWGPTGLALDAAGDMFVTDTGNERIREIASGAAVVAVQATPTITWSNPADITYGTALSGTQLDATDSVQGTFVYTPASGTLLTVGSNQTLSVVFTPTDTTDYTTATASVSINVHPATPTVGVSPVNITYGTALANGQLAGTATWIVGGSPVAVAGTFTYTSAAGTVLHAGNGQSDAVTFAPTTDTTDYSTAPTTVTVNVAKATPTVSVSPVNITFGTALANGQLVGTAAWIVGGSPVAVAGTFTYTSTAGTVLHVSSGQGEAITFTPTADTTDYTTAATSVMVSVLPDPTNPGVFNSPSSTFFLKNSCYAGAADDTVPYGPPGANWEPIVGDWAGDGLTTLGLYNPATSTFFLKNSNSAGAADLTFNYGPADPGYNGTTNVGWTPLAGDWNGDGTTTIGLYNPATGVFYLKNTNSAGPADMTFQFGPGGPGWTPIAGDWDGNGTTTVGLYNSASGMFFLNNSNSAGAADLTFQYGPGGSLGWTPLAGVWSGSNATVGLYVPASGIFFLKNSDSAGPADMTFNYGPGGPGWTPLVGSWIASVGQSPDLMRAMVAAPAPADANATGLTTAALAPIAQQAIARWVAAGSSAATPAQIANTQGAVGNLPGGGPVPQSPAAMVIDRGAADNGGFVGPTPGDDQELAADTSDYAPPTLDPRAVDQLDLVTVVEQELEQVKLEQVNR